MNKFLIVSMIGINLVGCMDTASRLWDGKPLLSHPKRDQAWNNCSAETYKFPTQPLRYEKFKQCMRDKGYK